MSNQTRIRLLALLLGCSILPLLVFSVIVNQSTVKMLNTGVTQMYQQTIRETALTLSLNVQPFVDLLNYHAERADVIQIMAMEQQDSEQCSAVQQKLERALTNNETAVRVGYPYAYMAVTKAGRVYTEFSYEEEIRAELLNCSWFAYLWETHYPTKWIGVGENVTGVGHKERLYIAAPVLDGSENVGVLIYAVNIDFLVKQLNNAAYGEDSSMFILDENDQCVAAGSKNYYSYEDVAAELQGLNETTTSRRIGRVENLITVSDTALSYVQTSWRIVAVTPVSYIHQETVRIKAVAVSLTLLLALMDVFILTYIDRHYFEPIVTMYGAMREVCHGNLQVRLHPTRQDEIGELHNSFDAMAESLDQNIRRIQEEEKQKRELELRVLQEQIRPHFVSNTLNTIRIMAEMRHATGISNAVMSFMNLIEYYFRETDFLSTVRDEILHLRQYVYLQNLRFQNRFVMEEKIESQIYQCPMLKLSLQPIVENCIKHGFPDRGRQGVIRIIGRQQGQTVVIQVADNGVGMDRQTLERFFSAENLQTGQNRHQGIANVHRRISMHFGEAYGVTAESEPGHGTTVTLTFPLVERQKGDLDEGSHRG